MSIIILSWTWDGAKSDCGWSAVVATGLKPVAVCYQYLSGWMSSSQHNIFYRDPLHIFSSTLSLSLILTHTQQSKSLLISKWDEQQNFCVTSNPKHSEILSLPTLELLSSSFRRWRQRLIFDLNFYPIRIWFVYHFSLPHSVNEFFARLHLVLAESENTSFATINYFLFKRVSKSEPCLQTTPHLSVICCAYLNTFLVFVTG